MTRRKQSLAKLTPPILPRVIERTRLFRLLDRATTAPLTWIAAPPGAGKTTLLTSYLQKRARTVLWYRLDAGDADPATLFHYLGLAVQAAAPRFRTRLPHLTPEYFAGLPIFTQRYFEQLGSRFRRPTVLVFDNYQEVAATSIVHQLLPVGIQQLPPQVRVVILSRETPPQAYARMDAEQQLRSLQPVELELTRTEARQVHGLHVPQRLQSAKAASIDRLWELAQGWMAGFILLLERGIERNAAVDLPAHDSPQAVFEYLAGEVMGRFPAETQQVLTTMSLVPDFTPEMAIALSGHSEAGRILERLHQARYFIERREDRAGWYRYHPLFRDFLRRRAQQAFDAATLRRLHQSAASFLIDAHCEDDAVALFEAAAAWEPYRALIHRHAPILMQQGRIQTLEIWITRLPESERAADPWMDIWLARCRLAIAPKESTPLFEKAFNQFRERGDQEGMLLAWAGVVHSIVVSWSGLQRIPPWLKVFEEIHPAGTPFPSLEVEALVAAAMAGAYMNIAPDRPEARPWLDRAVALLNRLPPSARPASSTFFTEIYYLWLDDLPTAQAILAEFRTMVEQREAPLGMRTLYLALSATLAWVTGDVEGCRRYAREGFSLGESSGLRVLSSLIIAQGAYNELFIENVVAARVYIDQMKPISEMLGGLHHAQYFLLACWADLLEGNIDQAWQKDQQCQAIYVAEGHPPFPFALDSLIRAQILEARGKRKEAELVLAEVEALGLAMPSRLLTNGVYFLRAQWAFDDGDEVRGTAALRQLLEEGQKSQLVGFIGWPPRAAARLFAKALTLGIEVPYALEVIRKRQLKPPPDGSAPEHWPWRVKVRTLGKLTVEIDGKPLEKHRKAPHRLLDLLTALIAFGGQDVLVSRLTDMLWPDADGDTAQENFKKSIARLRKLLAIEDVIQWREGKVSLNRDLCWVDALAFETHAKRAESPTINAKSHREGERQAIALYQGPFLGLEEIPVWAESRRDQVRTRFVRLVNHRCDQARAAGHPEEAIRALEQAIDVDPVAEPLYQRLIPLLAEQGRQADAGSYIDKCKSALARWADRLPSSDTLRLIQTR